MFGKFRMSFGNPIDVSFDLLPNVFPRFACIRDYPCFSTDPHALSDVVKYLLSLGLQVLNSTKVVE